MKPDTDMEYLENVLKMAPHTKVKHKILKNYLNAWFPIMYEAAKNRGRTILYIDGFAGPGLYDEGDVGSPILALDCLLNHQLNGRMLTGDVTFIFIFIEKSKSDANILRKRIDDKFSNIPDYVQINIINGEFEKEMVNLLSQTEERLPPTFAFIDPFGYTLSMSVLSKIMHNERCEILVNFMSGFVNRFAGADPKNDPKFNSLFGCEDWHLIEELDNPAGRREFVLNLYKSQLKSVTGAQYTQTFEMKNHHNQVCYDLIYATNNRNGMKHMKEAMWRVVPNGTYSFSDTAPITRVTLQDFMDDCERFETIEIARLIYEQFRGKKVPVSEIEWYVVLETPYLFRKVCLKKCDEDGHISLIERTESKKLRKGTYPDDSIITFSS